jgi:hypothetical protein
MGYTDDETMVKVDFFKDTGKWYTTEAMKWDKYTSGEDGNYEDIKDIFKRCLRQHLKGRMNDMIAVCIEPYHQHAHPLMVFNW